MKNNKELNDERLYDPKLIDKARENRDIRERKLDSIYAKEEERLFLQFDRAVEREERKQNNIMDKKMKDLEKKSAPLYKASDKMFEAEVTAAARVRKGK